MSHGEKMVEAAKKNKTKRYTVLFTCEKCDFKDTEEINVVKHKKNTHISLTNNYDQCDFKTFTESKLTKHKEKEHANSGIIKTTAGFMLAQCSILYFSTQLDMAQLVRSRTTVLEHLAPSFVKSDN